MSYKNTIASQWMSIITFSLMFVFISILTITSYAQAIHQKDKNEIKDQLKQIWDSLDTLEFREEAFQCNENLQPDLSQGYGRHEYAFGSAGRRASLSMAIYPESKTEKVISDIRRDGEKRYIINKFKDDNETINSVHIMDEPEKHNDSPTLHVHVMSFLTPFGKPLYFYVDEPAKLGVRRDEEGRDLVVLSSRFREMPVRWELDPSHDWFPVHYSLGDVLEGHVTRFGMDNGRWFPTEGFMITKNPDQPVDRVKFVISNLKINRPIPDSRFSPPKLSPGVIVRNATTGTARIEGNSLHARKELELKHQRNPEVVSVSTSESRGAAVEPEQMPWRVYLVVASSALLTRPKVEVFRRSGS